MVVGLIVPIIRSSDRPEIRGEVAVGHGDRKRDVEGIVEVDWGIVPNLTALSVDVAGDLKTVVAKVHRRVRGRGCHGDGPLRRQGQRGKQYKRNQCLQNEAIKLSGSFRIHHPQKKTLFVNDENENGAD